MKRADVIRQYYASFGRVASDEILVAYGRVLGSLADWQLERAIALAMQQGGAFPLSAGELLKLGWQLDAASFEARAVKAWRDLTIIAEKYGLGARIATGLATRSDGAIVRYALERIGGWGEFVKPPDGESMPWQRREFMRHYATAAANPQLVQHYTERLSYAKPIGQIQDENAEATRTQAIRGIISAIPTIRRLAADAIDENSKG